MKSLNGIQPVVTGGASGIGRATVEALVAKGARVRVISRSADKLEKVKHEVKGAIETVQGEVTDSVVVARALEGITPNLVVLSAGQPRFADLCPSSLGRASPLIRTTT